MPTVMVIEDEEEIITLAQFIFARMDFDVVGATASHSVLDQMEQVQPVLVMLDVMMPDMDGVEFYELMRARDALKDIPVIVVTAHEIGESNYQRWLDRGASDFVTKPFTPNDLLGRVKKILSG